MDYKETAKRLIELLGEKKTLSARLIVQQDCV